MAVNVNCFVTVTAILLFTVCSLHTTRNSNKATFTVALFRTDKEITLQTL